MALSLREVDEDKRDEDPNHSYLISSRTALTGALAPFGKEFLGFDHQLFECIKILLSQKTLVAEQEVVRLIMQHEAHGSNGWGRIDAKRTYGLSNRANQYPHLFAIEALEHLPDDHPNPLLIELGAGTGVEFSFFAEQLKDKGRGHVVGADANADAVREIGEKIKVGGLSGVAEIFCQDYLTLLERYRNQDVALIFAFSSLHYHPPLFLKEVIFPLIAEVLRSKTADLKPGKLYFTMKCGSAPSANNESQINLMYKNDDYSWCFHKMDRLFRLYPNTIQGITALLEPNFIVNSIELLPVEGYSETGEVEQFWHVIATPKLIAS